MAFINLMPSSLKNDIYTNGPSIFLGRSEQPSKKETLNMFKTLMPWYFGTDESTNVPDYTEKGIT